jgi:urease accessory protein
MRSARAEDRLGGAVASGLGVWPAHAVQSGWQAELALRFEARGPRTVIAARRQRGPLTVQRPFHPEGDGVCHTYVLHPPAGIVGGDDLAMTFAVEPGAHALVTTPAATRWYFSRGREARLRQEATIAPGGRLEWLPQETLVFAGAHARLATRIALHGDARFLGWEILGLGRPACDEPFRDGRLDFRFELARDGRPLLLEHLRGGTDGVAGMRGHTTAATLLATPADDVALDAARAALAGDPEVLAGATRMGDLLAVRGLAARCEPLVRAFVRVWEAVRPLVVDRVAVVPRIWHT